jgi:FkbM family methyltransferase
MLSNKLYANNPEYQKKVHNNIMKVHNKDLLPINHVNYLKKLKEIVDFHPRVCYDIGACVLHWTRHAESIWSNTKVILFDAFEPASFLYKDHDHHVGVLSDEDNKEIKFYQNDLLFGGNSYYKERDMKDREVYFPEENHLVKITRSLDSVVLERNFPFPDLIKIDVQGAELDILKGATKVLEHAKILLIELQHQEYNQGAPLVNVTRKYLEDLGWECTTEKFSNNGPDADYCFINKKLVIQ